MNPILSASDGNFSKTLKSAKMGKNSQSQDSLPSLLDHNNMMRSLSASKYSKNPLLALPLEL
jgi:hypothetical protein